MKRVVIEDKTFYLYLDKSRIKQIVKEVADRLKQDFQDKSPIFLPVLNGSFMFASDLFKHFSFPAEVSFIKVASYRGIQSSGSVNELIGVDPEEIKGRTVVIIEDIIETGRSVSYVIQKLREYQAADVQVCSLFFKPDSLQKDITVNYIGKSIPDDFIVGYGTDYNGFGRNLKEIYQLRN